MRYNDLILRENQAGFVLHPALDPANYQITDSIRDLKKWRAMTYVDNNAGKGIGQMDEVGYIMISLVDNTIVPIARGDEHHEGMDLLYTFMEGDRKLGIKPMNIDPEQFVPISHTSNYIYRREDGPKLAKALRKYLAYGGRDGMVTGTSDMRGKTMHASEFVAAEGHFFEIVHGELAPIGKRIYEMFKKLADMISAAHDNDDRIKLQPIFREALMICKYLGSDYLFMKMGVFKMMQDAPKTIRELQKNNDLQGLREYIFGFHGVKNVMHTELKKMNVPGSWQIDDAKAIWGDVELAIDLLAKL